MLRGYSAFSVLLLNFSWVWCPPSVPACFLIHGWAGASGSSRYDQPPYICVLSGSGRGGFCWISLMRAPHSIGSISGPLIWNTYWNLAWVENVSVTYKTSVSPSRLKGLARLALGNPPKTDTRAVLSLPRQRKVTRRCWLSPAIGSTRGTLPCISFQKAASA